MVIGDGVKVKLLFIDFFLVEIPDFVIKLCGLDE
jgi:hypothetical protein